METEMVSHIDAKQFAEKLIAQYGIAAEQYADAKMYEYMKNNDAKMSGMWLGIAIEIKNLQTSINSLSTSSEG